MHAKTDRYPKPVYKVRKALLCHCLDFVARQYNANWKVERGGVYRDTPELW